MRKKNKYLLYAVVIIGIMVAFMIITSSSGSSNVDVVGSTSVQPTMEKLVEVYKESHPDIDINVQGGGSSVGIKSTQDGSADIGMCSKDINNTDNKNLNQYELGKDGIVIAINNNNFIDDLSNEQLKDIFSGKITNWNEVGGNDGKINVVTREDGSGTLDAFESIVMDNTKIKRDAIVQSSTEAVKQSVSQDPNAIGFVSFAHMSSDVKALNVNGVEPSEKTISDGTYELQRPFLLLTNGKPTGDIKEFIDWAMGDEASKVLYSEKIIKANS